MRGVSLLQVTFKVVCGYVNTCIPLVVYSATGECLHSSFVVFYFVFVFRLLSDVNHGATAFLQSLAPAKHSGEEFLYLFNILLLLEDSEERRATAGHRSVDCAH